VKGDMNMKTMIIVLCAMFMSSAAMADEAVSVPVVANVEVTAEAKAESQENDFTNADKQELKELLGLLRATVGAEKAESESKGVVVADKALTLLEKLITQIATTVEKMAPDVFRIMYRQQIAKAFGNLIVPWLILFVTVLYILLIRRLWPWEGEDDGSTECGCHIAFTAALPLIICLAMCIWGLIALSNSICYLYNPEYYAIRDLINILMGSAQL